MDGVGYELEGWHDLRPALIHALDDGVGGVAVLKPNGDPIAIGGWLERSEVRGLAALASKQGPPDLLDRLFRGEIATASDGRTIYLAIAARCVFVLVVADVLSPDSHKATALRLRDEIESAIQARRDAVQIPSGWRPPPTSSGGSGSPPAEAFVFLSGRARGQSN